MIFFLCSSVDISSHLLTLYNECSNYNIDVFNHSNNDQDKHDLTLDIDPDRNFYNALDVHCRYYTDLQFNDCYDMCSGMSMFNINCGSMHRNFNKLCDYLNSFIRKFVIIWLSETWLNASDNIDLFQLFGYKNILQAKRWRCCYLYFK